MYEESWWATRSVTPDARMIGPSSTDYQDNLGSVKGLADYCEKAGITLDKAAWHFGDTTTVKEFQESLEDYISQKPAVGQTEYYYEEYNGHVGSAYDELKAISNIDRSGIDIAIRGIWEWANGLSDMVEINFTDKENPYKRNLMWWITTAYGNMSGTRIRHTGTGTEPYICSYDEEKGEVKLLIASNQEGTVNIDFTNSPFADENIRIDKYKISKEIIQNTENDGIQFQNSENIPSSGDTVSTSVSFGADASQEAWLVVMKKTDSVPSDFYLMTPDDGMAAGTAPEFTWQEAQGADSYTFTIAEDKKFENVVYEKSGIKGESYTLEEPLEEGKDYYWTVTAQNDAGGRKALNGMYYSVTASDHAVPSIFTMLQPIDEDNFVPLNTHFSWSPSIDADGYKIYISKSPDFSDAQVITVDDQQYLNDHYLEQNQERKTYNYYLSDEEQLEPDTKYYAYMSAFNEAGERIMAGSAHEFTTTTADGKPAEFATTFPENSAVVDPRFTLRWETSTAAQFYKLEIAEDPEFQNMVLSQDMISVPAYTMEANVLEPDTTYYWRVTAEDWKYDGETGLCSVTRTTMNTDGVRSFTTSAKPEAPILKTAIPVKGGAIVLFESIDAADSYVVKYGTESGNYTEQVETTEALTYIPLKEGETYYWTVETVKDGTASDTWGELTAAEGSDNLEVALDTALEAELFPNQENVSFSTENGPSGALAVRFSEVGSGIGVVTAEESKTLTIRYRADQDTTVGLYNGNRKIQDVDLYETGEGRWEELTLEVPFTADETLRMVKETAEGDFVIAYIILSNKDAPAYENIALNKPATADSVSMQYSPDRAVDGSRGASSWWRSNAVATDEAPGWLDIDLEGTAKIYSFDIALPDSADWGPRSQEITILTSLDGVEYTEMVPRTEYQFDMSTNNNVCTVTLPEPVEASHVKLEVYSNSEDADHAQIGEFMIYGELQKTGEENLAYKKPVETEDSGTGAPSNIVDGDRTNYTDFGASNFPNEVIIDLGQVYALEWFEMYLPSQWGSRTQEIEFRSSMDGKTYTSLVEKDDYFFEQGTNHVTLTLPENSAGRYIMIIGTANDEVDKPGLQFGEFEVYGSHGTPVEGIDITRDNEEVKAFTTLQLDAVLTPENATNNMMAWSTSNFDVARVDGAGLVTPIAPGEAVIRVRSIDGSFKDTCKVTVVKNNIVSVTNPEDMEVPYGTELTAEDLPKTLPV